MYQAIRELRAAPGRTTLITVTIGLIAVLVTFLSALTAGLAERSVSGLEDLLGDDALVIADTGAGTLGASRLDPDQLAALGGAELRIGRLRVGETPAVTLPDPALAPGHARVAADLGDQVAAGAELDLGSDVRVRVDSVDAADAPGQWLEHQPVVHVSAADSAATAGPAAAAIVAGEVPEVAGTTVLTGADRLSAVASYRGEQTSLGTMTALLYLISALVVGAFFMVWTVQRLRSVAIAGALGASRRVLVADALGQAGLVLVAGIGAGLAVTLAAGAAAGGVMPVRIDASTTAVPAALLMACGLAGAAVSLRPVLRAEPRAALAAG
ncbi:FtsX-like permease family protein [Corynebacterium sphenisci]|uniref:FtsX-like permease family protein n=1 Tax=Corynebacterium sphenisci TaxID=191493 RepID=UPI0026E063A3|nr:ABC transporter permease [Corynebacterium sphenisci]MDO5730284.1 ABC transporter permease [Corynebacterium sphenisci]